MLEWSHLRAALLMLARTCNRNQSSLKGWKSNSCFPSTVYMWERKIGEKPKEERGKRKEGRGKREEGRGRIFLLIYIYIYLPSSLYPSLPLCPRTLRFFPPFNALTLFVLKAGQRVDKRRHQNGLLFGAHHDTLWRGRKRQKKVIRTRTWNHSYIITYYMFRAICQLAQFINCAVQFVNSQFAQYFINFYNPCIWMQQSYYICKLCKFCCVHMYMTYEVRSVE